MLKDSSPIVGQRYGFADSTILRVLDLYEIPIRSHSEATKVRHEKKQEMPKTGSFRVVLGYLKKVADEEHLLPQSEQRRERARLVLEQDKMLRDLERRVGPMRVKRQLHAIPTLNKLRDILLSGSPPFMVSLDHFLRGGDGEPLRPREATSMALNYLKHWCDPSHASSDAEKLVQWGVLLPEEVPGLQQEMTKQARVLPSVKTLNKLELIKAAQSVYDDWDDGLVEELNGGGICHLIADEMVNVLSNHGVENVATVSAAIGEQHVYVVAAFEEGVFEIDIPPGVYETGGGYSWSKREDVVFEVGDLVVSCIDGDPSTFENYIDSM